MLRKPFAVALVASSLCMLVLDGLWIFFVMKREYERVVRGIQRGGDMLIRGGYALLAYALMVLALALIIWQTAHETLWTATLIAAAWGLLLYGIYASTVLALFRDFPLRTAVLDMGWGFVLFGASVWLGRIIASHRHLQRVSLSYPDTLK